MDITPYAGGTLVGLLVAASAMLFIRSWGASQKQMDTFIGQTNKQNEELRAELGVLKREHWQCKVGLAMLAGILSQHDIPVPREVFGVTDSP